MTPAPPGGRGEILKVRQIVKETTRNDLLICSRLDHGLASLGLILGSLAMSSKITVELKC